ncbi:signal peptidase, endoplasmic reticulum-type [Haloplanus vescus]|uniref:Signal peptidase, endoplasmic reticulum-type n=1 Tax=Haloplanus vescus TaxID=555874 RepID=A0A1H3VYX9_9EURY|nr:signal peptidase I [Haloplanus vescus]SDZ79891.1 signal peptidase, endoplasmic reticulum-type [Haloplanus vescus]
MSIRRTVTLGGEVLAIVFVVSLVAGQVLGYPVLLGFVETGSMAPTLNPGDGFVAVPTALDDDIEEGDVIVFRAQQLHGGGLTTHRVVGETERGYITRGDANPFTDQDGDEPPVKDPQIVAKAWQPGGSVVVIPNLGTAVMGIQTAASDVQTRLAALLGTRSLLGSQGLMYILLGLSVLLYVFDILASDGSGRGRSRSRNRDEGISPRLLVGGFAAVLVVTATAAMVVPAGTQEYGIVSAEFDSERPTTIPQGESSSLDYTATNAGLIPVYVYLEPGSDDVEVAPGTVYVGGRATANATMTLHAPPETGYYRRYLVEYRYLALLPEPVIDGLYRVHPWLPIVVIDALLGGALYLLGMSLIGSERVRTRSRGGPSKLRRLANRFG